MFSRWLSMCLSVRLSEMIPVSEADKGNNSKISPNYMLGSSNISVALNLCLLFYLGAPNQGNTIQRKICHDPNTATLQHDSFYSNE